MTHICCIAAHDTSNGAGITRDCIVAYDFGVMAHPAITALTTQSFDHVESIWPIPVNRFVNQLNSIAFNFSLSAIKIGMLYSPDLVNIVADFIANHQDIPIIVDPIITSSGGEPLVTSDAMQLIISRIIPFAKLISPNRYEFEILSKHKVDGINDTLSTAREFAKKHNCKVLLKGGHFEGSILTDFLVDENEIIEVPHERRKYTFSHGSGCVLSTAITCSLALGYSYRQALSHAVDYTLRYFDSMNIALMHQ